MKFVKFPRNRKFKLDTYFKTLFWEFLTAISHRGLRNDFFFIRSFTFHILFGLLFPFSIWTFISLFYLDFYFETFRDISKHFETFRDISRHFESFWDILRHFETFRETFRDISIFFDLFSIFSIAVWFWIFTLLFLELVLFKVGTWIIND